MVEYKEIHLFPPKHDHLHPEGEAEGKGNLRYGAAPVFGPLWIPIGETKPPVSRTTLDTHCVRLNERVPLLLVAISFTLFGMTVSKRLSN